MKVKTKFIFLFLICLALILFVPNKANATYYNSEISYNEHSDYVEVVAAGKNITKVTSIPTVINGKPVTRLSGFNDCKDLKSINIPSSVTTISVMHSPVSVQT